MTKTHSVGIRSLAVRFPRVVRTNDYWRRVAPEVVAAAEEKTYNRMFQANEPLPESRDFDAEMAPYASDPFRGTAERRVLGRGESALTLEREVARDALQAAALGPTDIDLMIVGAFRPHHLGVGDAAYLAADLGLTGSAWNMETACAVSVSTLETAVALVRAGQYRKILVVVSCTYSRDMDERDSLAWFLGDGAGAFVVAQVPEGEGVLGTKAVHTGETCGALFYEMIAGPGGAPRVVIQATQAANHALRNTSAPNIRRTCFGALDAAGLRLEDVDFFVCNTPVASFHRFFARTLGVSPEKTLTTFPRYANAGPALTTANLYEAAYTKRIAAGDIVLMYAIGSVSTAGAAVMRWGDVALGPAPEPSSALVHE